jgi:hypothetical protein
MTQHESRLLRCAAAKSMTKLTRSACKADDLTRIQLDVSIGHRRRAACRRAGVTDGRTGQLFRNCWVSYSKAEVTEPTERRERVR